MNVEGVVGHLFRRSAGQMVAAITRALGPDHMTLAEEVVQDAMVKALQTWPFQGVPENPRGWLYRVALNRGLDALRRDAARRDKLLLLPPPDQIAALPEDADPFADDELAMIFMCCHPALTPDARIALTLKGVAGFSVPEIAAAFLAEPAAIAQRLVRAKKTLVQRGVEFEIPDPVDARDRIDSVLEALYLLFNEGYDAHDGDRLVRDELCFEAIRLGELLIRSPAVRTPEVHALLALLCLQASRLPARLDENGEVVLLRDQNRSRWDRELIGRGVRHLSEASSGDRLTSYHVQAAIAAAHTLAADDASTDWEYILDLYDRLLLVSPSPVFELNRAVAVAHVHGPARAIEALLPLLEYPAMRRYYLLPAMLGGSTTKSMMPRGPHSGTTLRSSCRAMPLSGAFSSENAPPSTNRSRRRAARVQEDREFSSVRESGGSAEGDAVRAQP